MAGIYIPGMEMPKSCIECRFCGEDAMCDVLGEDLFDYLQNQATYVEYLPDEWKNADCPLLPVPEHGDLIDRDALCEGRVSNDNVVICAKTAPTIIPASTADKEGEA